MARRSFAVRMLTVSGAAVVLLVVIAQWAGQMGELVAPGYEWFPASQAAKRAVSPDGKYTAAVFALIGGATEGRMYSKVSIRETRHRLAVDSERGSVADKRLREILRQGIIVTAPWGDVASLRWVGSRHLEVALYGSDPTDDPVAHRDAAWRDVVISYAVQASPQEGGSR